MCTISFIRWPHSKLIWLISVTGHESKVDNCKHKNNILAKCAPVYYKVVHTWNVRSQILWVIHEKYGIVSQNTLRNFARLHMSPISRGSVVLKSTATQQTSQHLLSLLPFAAHSRVDTQHVNKGACSDTSEGMCSYTPRIWTELRLFLCLTILWLMQVSDPGLCTHKSWTAARVNSQLDVVVPWKHC